MNLWLEKQQHLIDFTLASLARRKTKNIGLLIAYTLLVFVLASLPFFPMRYVRKRSMCLPVRPKSSCSGWSPGATI